MTQAKSQKRRLGLLTGLALLLILTASLAALAQVYQADAESPPCGAGGGPCPVVGDFNPISLDGSAPPGEWAISGPAAPAFGALVYDPDFKNVEMAARTRLERGLSVRQTLSPYRGNLEFQEYVMKFDYASGWNREYTGENPYNQPMTLITIIDRADQDLREARDLYAYLLVFSPQARFREDGYYTGDPPAGYNQPLCGVEDKEDPDPADPAHTGLVLDPVIDWCNFHARLRQSVREAANLHLLFGQQFMVDAMGLHFSGVEFVGGDEAVRRELAQFRAAKHQYEQAEQGLIEGLTRVVGNGCYVSDFYTQAEWSLLSRSVENQIASQHQIAVRTSYMDISSPGGVPAVHDKALESYRQAAIDGHIKLIAGAALVSQPVSLGCQQGERPDGSLVAEMVQNMLETQRKVAELGEGRNIFGFDVTFTPARFYKSSGPVTCDEIGSGDRGLWDEARCAALYAKELQNDEVANTRAFDKSQADLRTEVEKIRTVVDGEVGDRSGCYRSDFANDQAWFDCTQVQTAELKACRAYANRVERDADGNIIRPSLFDLCMSRKDGQGHNIIRASGAQRALLDLRTIYLGFLGVQEKAGNIQHRIANSNDKTAKVTDWMFARGAAETAARAAEAAADMIACMDDLMATKSAPCGIAGGINIALQTAAGVTSMLADVEIENAENHKEVQNLLLDMSELVIEAHAAYQQFLSKESEFESYMADLSWSVLEAKRARAYFQNSPANDPSFRMVRDSSRLVLAKQMDYAARISYLAARRAEYEYAARLSASNFRISDIYRSRTADDILRYLTRLQAVTNNLAGSASYQMNANDLTISVAQHILLLTDEALAKEGFTDPQAVQAERTRRLRLWAAENTYTDSVTGKPVLRFSFTTSLMEGGTFSQIIKQAYNRYWLLKMSGIGAPLPGSNGIAVNLVSEQSGLDFRNVAVTQGGLVHLRSFSGCTFDYRLVAPAVLLGYEWASNQNPEVATATWKGNVNSAYSYTTNGFRASELLGRAASSTDWMVDIYAGAPVVGLPDMNLQKLNDIELLFSITYASRSPGTPTLNECTRIDW